MTDIIGLQTRSLRPNGTWYEFLKVIRVHALIGVMQGMKEMVFDGTTFVPASSLSSQQREVQATFPSHSV